MDKNLSDITWEKLSALTGLLDGSAGRPAEDDPRPIGPWGPVIRIAIERVSVFGPHPEPWKTSVSGEARAALIAVLNRHLELWELAGGAFGGLVSLNPQPLPPRSAFMSAIANAVISRAELMQDVAFSMQSAGEDRGIIIVSGFVKRFSEEWCGTPFKPNFPIIPPGPRPHWLEERIDAADLIVLGTTFNRSASTAEKGLREAFSAAARTFIEAGIGRLS